MEEQEVSLEQAVSSSGAVMQAKNDSGDPENSNAAKAVDTGGELEKFLKLYGVPIATLAFSVIVIIFFTLPQVNGISSTLSLISEQQDEYERLGTIRESRLRLADLTNQQQADLAKIDSIIPQQQTEVVDFSEDIRRLAEQNRLNLTDSVVGEVVTANSQSPVQNPLPDAPAGLELVELPADFSLSGDFSNIQSFLSDIFGAEDFIIVKEMELIKRAQGDSEGSEFSLEQTDSWNMDITLAKYQFRLGANTTEENVTQTYFRVPESQRPDQQVLDFMNENY
ncbi:MAG: hypothetical protein ACOCXP_00675 [Candidatus Dojkabacteria bacterium]